MLPGGEAIILIFFVNFTPGDLTTVLSHFLFSLKGVLAKFHMTLFFLRLSWLVIQANP